MDFMTVLGEIVRYLGEWIPRPRIVRLTDGGIRFWFGKWASVVRPGWRLEWPAVMELEIVPVVRQVTQLTPQTLFTRDSRPVIAGAVIVWSIEDVHKYLVENFEAEDSVTEVAGYAVRDAIVGKTLEQIQETDGRRGIDRSLLAEASKALAKFGVKVEVMRLTDFAPARVLNLVGAFGTTTNTTVESTD
jgi:regulator of protease activity HflC (stomatin/prohibitin superfamily)